MESGKDFLRQRARELGFALCGFTTPDPPERYPLFAEWISAGRHAGMQYLAAERSLSARAQPSRLLPAARSILALGMPYPPPPEFENRPLEGRVAAYALGEDYHDILPERLRSLCRDIDSLAGRRLEHRVYVDTGPVLEREIASRAGLGWIGRNSMLLHPQLGSFFFLAVILTGQAFPPDPRFAFDRCGKCDRCVKACPTGCILSNRTIDSRRCIAYWTIEDRNLVPVDIRNRIGSWIFGCDICQIVCPWNRRTLTPADTAFLPRGHFPISNLAGETRLSEEEWEARFRRSPLRRIGRMAYLRNIILALGNSGSEEAKSALIVLKSNSSQILRESAIWALDHIIGDKR